MGVQPYSFPKANFLHSIRTEKQCCRKHMKPIPTSRPIYNHMQSLLVTTQLHALNKHIILCLTGESPISCWRQALLTPMKLHCSPIRKNAHNFSLLAPCNTCTQTNVKKYSKYIHAQTLQFWPFLSYLTFCLPNGLTLFPISSNSSLSPQRGSEPAPKRILGYKAKIFPAEISRDRMRLTQN